MILSKILPKYYSDRANKTFLPPMRLDFPDNGFVTFVEWNNYHTQEYDYLFNSWAFRGSDYSQFVGKPVNICLGDSFTLNIGGPVEHSWPSQLSKYFDIPTLNFGIDGAGNDTIRKIYDWAIKTFDVKNTFVMYSFFQRRYDSEQKVLQHYDESSIAINNNNFKYFENHKIDHCYFTFLPAWCWSTEENEYINAYYTDRISVYRCTVDVNLFIQSFRSAISKKQYDIFRGADWPLYEQFIGGAEISTSVYNEIIDFIDDNVLRTVFSNRDGFHLNKNGHKMVCNYFLKQLDRTPMV